MFGESLEVILAREQTTIPHIVTHSVSYLQPFRKYRYLLHL